MGPWFVWKLSLQIAYPRRMLAPILVAAIAMTQPDLDQICRDAFVATKAKLAAEKLTIDDVSMTIMAAQPDGTWRSGGFEEDQAMYPASVVKLFWLAYAHHVVKSWSTEDLRAARDMIVDSNNDATGHIVNLATSASPGPELGGREYEDWTRKRLSANAWFKGLGYEGINVLNRTYNEGPYGREAQLIKDHGRNALTTKATARLMAAFADDRVDSKSIARWMPWLKRDMKDGQFGEFLGAIMPKDTQHWSKAGWTSEVRHDVSFDIFPDGRRFVFCIFTKRPDSQEVLQTLGGELLKGLGLKP